MDLSKAKYIAPNSLTLTSIFCGIVSINLALTGDTANDMMLAAWLLVVAMVCDAADGRVARMTKAESALGVQLDSLADMVSFGVAPAMLLYAWGMKELGTWGLFFWVLFCGMYGAQVGAFQRHGLRARRRHEVFPRPALTACRGDGGRSCPCACFSDW